MAWYLKLVNETVIFNSICPTCDFDRNEPLYIMAIKRAELTFIFHMHKSLFLKIFLLPYIFFSVIAGKSWYNNCFWHFSVFPISSCGRKTSFPPFLVFSFVAIYDLIQKGYGDYPAKSLDLKMISPWRLNIRTTYYLKMITKSVFSITVMGSQWKLLRRKYICWDGKYISTKQPMTFSVGTFQWNSSQCILLHPISLA